MLNKKEEAELIDQQKFLVSLCREELIYLLQIELRYAAERNARLRMFLDFDKKEMKNAE